MIRSKLAAETKDAMRSKEALRLSTLRLINAAIKDRDIAARSEDNSEGVSDAEILAILGKMVKQRQDSAKAYEEAGRIELAEQEMSEISVIQGFMPKQMTGDEVASAIDAVIAETGASSIRDMGAVMGALKEKYAGQMDFGKVGGVVKGRLG